MNNCKQVSKLVLRSLNSRLISNHPPLSPEQLYSCFSNDSIDNLSTLRFVPKKQSTKIPAHMYNEPSIQARISRRLSSIQRSSVVQPVNSKNRLKHLMEEE
ncbi:uncharacterized protein LOC129949274 [Eupeodes corollae]|uniref:uncharacterized protein LOC129949274 n=1 Tax=Eupeodes corollae TaxID=290404 RepID=UPI00248FB3C8|nr:uncharacterized protein LOC129949274 [Eupeodes corollae]